MIKNLFISHPNSVGESYGEHFLTACGFSLRLIASGLACLVHALLPFLFVNTGSEAITKLHEIMLKNRSNRA